MSQSLPTLNLLPSRSDLRTDSSLDIKGIAVVDAAAKQYQYLRANPPHSMEIHILNEQEDGITQIQSLLHQYQCLSMLFLFCQGAPGRINLGTTLLSEANLWAYADAIRQWRNYLTQDAEIIIHGCDLATNRTGKAFVSWLEFLTRACVQVV